MSRIFRYQESIIKYIKKSSFYSNIFKNNSFESFININDHEISILLLTIITMQSKKTNTKISHGYCIASGIDLMMNVVMVLDNMKYYEKIYSKKILWDLIHQMPIYINLSISQNINMLVDGIGQEKVYSVYEKISNYINKKMIDITRHDDYKGKEKMHKLDVVKYKFNDAKIAEKNYKNLNMIDKYDLIAYINRTYGYVCQCALVAGWMLGMGDEKTIPQLEKIGLNLGMLIKLSSDFQNLERDINNPTEYNTTHNLIANHGIHNCFQIFDQNKIEFYSECLELNLENTTIKEVIDVIDKKFDKFLDNTDLDLTSKYTNSTIS